MNVKPMNEFNTALLLGINEASDVLCSVRTSTNHALVEPMGSCPYEKTLKNCGFNDQERRKLDFVKLWDLTEVCVSQPSPC